jgi:hypothetical protein
MSITGRSSNRNTLRLRVVGAETLAAMARRWRASLLGMSKALAGVRDPRPRADIQRLSDADVKGQTPEQAPLPEARAEALAAVCEMLLRQFDDEQAGAAEIRLVVHKRDALSTEPGPGARPDSRSALDVEDDELVWELRRLLASSGGAIAEVALELERRGDVVDRKGRELLQEEIRAVEVDIALLKTVLSDPVDWDGECKRLLASEVPPFEDPAADDDRDDEDA